jgi:hypothetical protein
VGAVLRKELAGPGPRSAGSGGDPRTTHYAPSLRVHATKVSNEAEWHHRFRGYLATPEVRDTFHAHLGEFQRGSASWAARLHRFGDR